MTFWCRYLLPEILIAVVFAIIAACTEGAGAPLLAARLTAFVTKIRTALAALGKVGALVIKIFAKLDEIAKLIVKLVKVLKRKVDEVVESATDLVTRIVRRSGKRIKPPKEIPCFNKPTGVSDKDFMDQLQEQENAINNSDISELIARRDMVKQVGTSALRDVAAQTAARKKWLDDRIDELIDIDEMLPGKAAQVAAAEAAKLHATHVLDIVAGGDPSVISGLQNASVNSSIGSQWKSRVGALDDALSEHSAMGGVKANVKLRKC